MYHFLSLSSVEKASNCYIKYLFGTVDCSTAHLVWDQRVAGSNPAAPTIKFMKKAKIYIPTKSAMQSGKGKTKKWILEFETQDTGINPLMGWETSTDTMSEVKLEFDSKDLAIDFAEKNNIEYYIIEPQKSKMVKKSYADNFVKN